MFGGREINKCSWVFWCVVSMRIFTSDAAELDRASKNTNNEKKYSHTKLFALKVGNNRQRVTDLCVTSAGKC